MTKLTWQYWTSLRRLKWSRTSLPSKLDHYGVHGEIHTWIRAFLTGRSKRVLVNGELSGPASVTSGAPQGTVLGPLLFLCYINDLPLVVKSQARLFADDCLLYRPIKTRADQIIIQQDLDSLQHWSDLWQMMFNPVKCYSIRYARSRRHMQCDYTLCDTQLAQVNQNHYLEVLLSDDAKWGEHIKVTKNVNSTLAFLCRNLIYCPSKLKELAYNSLVWSTLEYARTVWDPHLVKDIMKLEAVERRAARFVVGDFRRWSSVTEMLQILYWSSLEERGENEKLIMLHKIISGGTHIAAELLLFPPSQAANKSRKRTQV